MTRPRFLLLLLLLPLASGFGQRTPPIPYGTVSGTIVCADTNLPAHFATVALEAVHEIDPPSPTGAPRTPRPPSFLSVYHSRLDGSFLIPRVVPGRYYVVVQNPGYLSPVAMFTQDQVNHPDVELYKAIAKVVPIVTISPNSAATLSISLTRAAAISGFVRYDDGSPGSSLSLQFQRRDKDGKFVNVTLSTSYPDELGHFHASGVPPGEYRLYTTLDVIEQKTDGLFGGGHSNMNNTTGGLKIYYGDTFHRKDAKSIKIEGGENTSADLTIPAARIHRISGTLIDSRTGHTINAGTVRIFDDDEKDDMEGSKVDEKESTFSFEYLPEGEYTVRVEDAKDVSREENPVPAGTLTQTTYKERTLHTYARYEGKLIVQTDQNNVTLPIPDAAAKPAP